MAEISTLIPKKTLGGGANIATSVGIGVFFRISFIFFLASAALTGGIYLVDKYLTSTLNEEKSLLKKIEIEFEPVLIAELERVGASIRAAKAILQSHERTSNIFNLLESQTLKDVSFSSFTFASDNRSITMSGIAPSYAGVAAQAAIFGALPEVVLVSFSNMSLNETGTVNFSVTINLK
jgi:hypothetical protein